MRVPAPQLRCHVRGSGCRPEGHSCLLSASSHRSSPPSDLPHYLLSHHRSHLRCSHRRPQPAPRGAGAAGEGREGSCGLPARPPGLQRCPGDWGRGAAPLHVLLDAQMDTGGCGSVAAPARHGEVPGHGACLAEMVLGWQSGSGVPGKAASCFPSPARIRSQE